MEDIEEKNNEELIKDMEGEGEGFWTKQKIAFIIIICFLISIGLVILAIIVYLARDYELEPLEVYEKYEKIKNISVGDGIVYKAKIKNTTEIVSIREIKLSTTDIRDDVKNDILFTQALQKYTKKSIEIKEIYEQRSTKFIVTEYYDFDLLINLKNNIEGFPVDKIKNIMTQLNEALKVLREKKIVHYDIRLESIFVQYNNSDNENEFEVKLGNYSKAKLLIDGDEKWENIKPYKKNKDEEEYNRIDKQDLFDIGKLIYRMVFNEINIDKEKINKEIEDENLKDLLNGLLVDDVKERIEWDDYFKHKFFKDNNDTSIDYINILTYLK
jgi:serine/threonine protein kinase